MDAYMGVVFLDGSYFNQKEGGTDLVRLIICQIICLFF